MDYTYQPLRVSADGRPGEFRILTLLPGTGTDDIRCRLSHHDFPSSADVDSAVIYEALSWTWGLDAPSESIAIVGQDDRAQGRKLVTSNLFSALMHMRNPSEPRNMWIDYICINQSDAREKDQQVKYFNRIYGCASNVCIWLGEPHEDGEDGESAMRYIKHQVSNFGSWDEADRNTEAAKRSLESMIALMNRKWFSRRWVVQELMLARKATIHCGQASLAYIDFETAVSLFSAESDRTSRDRGRSQSHVEADPTSHVRQSGASRMIALRKRLFRFDNAGAISQYRLTLTDLVLNLWPFGAKEPHDVFYAVFNLAQDYPGRNDSNVLPGVARASPLRSDAEGARQTQSATIPPDRPPEEAVMQRSEGSLALESISESYSHPMRLIDDGLESPTTTKPTHILHDTSNSAAEVVPNESIWNVSYEHDFVTICKRFLRHNIATMAGYKLDILVRPWAPARTERLPSWIPTLAEHAFKAVTSTSHSGMLGYARINADPLVGRTTFEDQMPSSYTASLTDVTGDKWYFENDGPDPRLYVTGFVLDTIESVQDASQFGNVSADWFELAHYSPRENDASGATDSLLRTLVANRGPNGADMPGHYRAAFDFAVSRTIVGGIMTSSLRQQYPNPLLQEFLQRVEEVVWKRRMFRSAREHKLGLAPQASKDGDLVCIVQGISVPVVLRAVHSAQQQPQYHLLGGCYLHDRMDGEALQPARLESQTEGSSLSATPWQIFQLV